MTDDRLKIWIDLLKWTLVSFGLVLTTKIIDTGFKDREVGISEIKEYDKYVSLVTDNSKLSERRLLAQYFANVTPSEKLKLGWAAYYKEVNYEYDLLVLEREDKKDELKKFESLPDTSSISFERIQELRLQIENIDNELTPTFDKKSESFNYNTAINWERIGFESVLDKNLNQAIDAFEKSENSYNSFHQVYEIANFLKSKRNSKDLENNDFWQEIYTKILNDYAWKIPDDIKIQLELQIKYLSQY